MTFLFVCFWLCNSHAWCLLHHRRIRRGRVALQQRGSSIGGGLFRWDYYVDSGSLCTIKWPLRRDRIVALVHSVVWRILREIPTEFYMKHLMIQFLNISSILFFKKSINRIEWINPRAISFRNAPARQIVSPDTSWFSDEKESKKILK